MKHNLGTLLGVVGVTTAATLFGATQAQAVILIDNFSVDQDDGGELLDPASSSSDSASDSSILGEIRTIDVADGPDGDVSSDSGVRVSDGNFRIVESVDSDVLATLTYDAGGTGLGGIDFSDESFIRFASSINDEVVLKTGVRLTDTASNSFRLEDQLTVGPQDDIFFPLSTFASNGVNLAGIDSVVLDINSEGTGVSSSIRQLDTADPVPFNAESWVGLALLGTWGSWKYWKKRNQSKLQLTASDEN